MHTNTLAEYTRNALAEIDAHVSDQLSSFYLAGGTAAALQIGHRISVDLDFFSENGFNNQQLA